MLREQLRNTVDLRFATSVAVVHHTAEGVQVTLSDGSALAADLLVGADGIHSTVRGLVFGEEHCFLRYLGFHTAAFIFANPRIHAEVNGRLCLTDTIDRQMGLYGLRDGRVATFAVHRTPDRRLPHDPAAAIRREYGSLGWIIPRAVQRCPSAGEVYYDQVAQIELPRWSRHRVVLLGDAAYAVSLLASQGASLAIAGAYVLAEQLARCSSVETALDRYERLWRPVAEEKQQVARDGVRWFLPQSRAQLRARHIVMRLSRLPGIDRYIAGALAGKSTALVKNLATSGAKTDPLC